MEGTRRAFCPKCDEVGGDIVKRSARRKRVKTTNLGADEQEGANTRPYNTIKRTAPGLYLLLIVLY